MLYKISRAKGAKELIWKNHEYKLEELKENGFGYHRETTDKDGPAFVPAALIGNKRNKNAVSSVCMFVFDVDGQQTYDEVKTLVAATGKYAIIYTTFSHKTTKTYVRTDQYAKWATKRGRVEVHTDDGIREYLKDTDKGHLKIRKVHTTPIHVADGFNILIEHDPIDKVRVVFPMESPFIIAEQAYTQAAALLKWKQQYIGVGNTIGLIFDKACADASRLFYFPSHPSDSPEFKLEVLDGPLIRFQDYAVASAEDTLRGMKPSRSPTGTLIDEETAIVEGFDVAGWFMHHGRGTGEKLIEKLREHSTDLVKGERSATGDKDGYHIQCPFEDEHSTPGGNGTFIDPKPDGHPKIFCTHSHCQGRLTEHFIAGIVDNGWITRGDLVEIGERAPQENALAAIGLDPATLGTSSTKVATTAEKEIDISLYGPKEVDDVQRNVVGEIKALAELNAPLPPGIFDALEKVFTGMEVKEVIAKAIEMGAVDSRALRIFCLAVSGMTLKNVKMYYGTYADDINLNHNEFIQVVKLVRDKKRPIQPKIDAIANSSIQNNVLQNERRYIAEYYDISYGMVATMCAEARAALSSEALTELDRRSAELTAKYAKWLRPSETLFIDIEQTEKLGELRAYTYRAVQGFISNECVEVRGPKGEPKRVDVMQYWYKQYPEHTRYLDVVFDPARKQQPFDDHYNLFFGFNAYKPTPGDAGPMLRHLKEVWCLNNEEVYHWLLTFMAAIFQKPGEKFHSAVAVTGPQGGGKSIVLEGCLVPLAMPYVTVSTRREDVAGRFNAAMENKLIFVAEEAMFAGDHETAARLKQMISGTTLQIERKGRDPVPVNNFVRFFFISNEIHALRLDADDRRFLVLKIADSRVGDESYFKALAGWLKTGGREIFLHYLLNWKPESVGLDWNCLNKPPRTFDKIAQIKHSQTPPEQFILELVRHGYVAGLKDEEGVANIKWLLDGQCTVPRRQWEELWDAFLRQNGIRFGRTHLEPTIKKIFGDKIQFNKALRPGEGEHKKAFTILPSRREALEQLCVRKLITEEDYINCIELGDGEVL